MAPLLLWGLWTLAASPLGAALAAAPQPSPDPTAASVPAAAPAPTPEAARPAGTGGDPAQVPWSLQSLLPRVPPLRHDPAGRLPLIAWAPFRPTPDDRSFEEGRPLTEAHYRELWRRGLTQAIPIQERYIPMALAMQQAGLPVVFMEGAAGNGPAPSEDAEHRLLKGYPLGPGERVYYHPLLIDGWARRADALRATLRKFKEAGVQITAAWLDWEEEPWPLADRWRQAAFCTRCAALFPPGTLNSLAAYSRFIRQYRQHLLSAYLAAPIREVYPAASVTNWAALFSTPDRPTRSVWGDQRLPPGDIGLFTAANPVAYGNNLYFQYHWPAERHWPLDSAHMDRVYTEIMLGNVSDNAANQERMAPWTQTIPWVARYCPDLKDQGAVPILSRERYREILRHIWLRGADAMQVFNPPRPEHPAIATEEIEDVVAVYDELLAYRDFLERGAILNTEPPRAPDDGAIWSGMRLGDRALIRAFTQGPGPAPFQVKPWEDGPPTTLEASPEGRTWVLTYQREDRTVTAEGR